MLYLIIAMERLVVLLYIEAIKKAKDALTF